MKLSVCSLTLVVLGLWVTSPALATEPKPKSSTVNTKAKNQTRKPVAPAKKAPVKSVAGKQVCQTRKIKTDKGVRTQRVCSAAPELVMKSPIPSNALEKSTNGRETEIKARSAPDRAYAVDGSSFFFQGRKYRVSGLSEAEGSDMAKQRLQKSLESGSLMIEPLSTDEHGVSTATIRINGRDIADQLR